MGRRRPSALACGALLVLAVACETSRSPALQAVTPTAPSAELEGDNAAAVETRPAWELVLASWNVEWLNREDQRGPVKRDARDYARLARYATLLAADVVALQEVDGETAAARVFDPKVYDFHFARGGGAQRAGFAWRRGLDVSVNPDVDALDVGGVRMGADLSVHTPHGTLRLLGVHLKSGCFDAALTDSNKACRKLARQLPELERWIDARALEVEHNSSRFDVPAGADQGQWQRQTRWFAVLGDFNRHLFARHDEPFWREIDDGLPPESDLDSPTRGQPGRCWATRGGDRVDHLVLGRSLFARVVPRSFREQSFATGEARFKSVLSDHCPLSVRVRLD